MADMNASSEPGVAKSFLERFLGVFIEPGAVFEDVARKPDFIAPLAVLILVSLAVTETMLSKIGIARIVRNTFMQSGRVSNLSPEQINQAIEKSAAVVGVFMHLSALFAVPIFLAAAAGIGLLVLNGIFGIRAGFKKVFSVACYADLPSILGGVMAMTMTLFGDPDHFNLRSPVPSNLGFFLNPQTTSHAMMALASSFDIFILWFLILLAMGLSRVSGRAVKSRSIFFIYFGLWMLLVMARVGLTALM
jgi:Yip1 domain